MSAVVFVGPSLFGQSLEGDARLVVRPPAAQGDIYRACDLRPQVIGLVDGYFEGVPSVWHKEILWALSQGIAVVGSASMGALRAAELDVFGMTGIGWIYESYRDGSLEDDDEVALLHGPHETGFVPLSEPMVNIRATCRAAVEAGALRRTAADAVVTAAKALHYKERTWAAALDRAGASAGAEACRGFADWLTTGRVDQKQRDAMALIAAALAALDQPPETHLPRFRFEWTDAWDRAVREWDRQGPPSDTGIGSDGVAVRAIVDELRLEPEQYVAVRAQAVQRAALVHGAGGAASIDPAARSRHLNRLRQRLGLWRKSDLDAWVERNGLNERRLEALLEEEAMIEAALQFSQAVIDRHILSVLQLDDSYARLCRRARRKRAVLIERGFAEASAMQTPLTPPVLVDWYFRAVLQQSPPTDLDGFIASLDIDSRQGFYSLVAGEYVYSNTGADAGC